MKSGYIRAYQAQCPPAADSRCFQRQGDAKNGHTYAKVLGFSSRGTLFIRFFPLRRWGAYPSPPGSPPLRRPLLSRSSSCWLFVPSCSFGLARCRFISVSHCVPYCPGHRSSTPPCSLPVW
ncbi:hypothetical protein LX36DRAFT_345740 [Colletotrichum falcatum]|nr:hypothetical protein LX36DRAFT_345740 [Colletotrichum falcatum]